MARPKRAKKSRAGISAGAEGKLADYHAKRDLRSSGEPSGSRRKGSAEGPRYVIQKHDATRLHYDFRLEMEGVLRSWAVPKGLPSKAGQKSLAVEVEDHPLDYGDFEGTIPDGNYGAGTVMLWDRGHYSVSEGTPEDAYRSGKLHLALSGEKCRGEWTLVRMKEKHGESKNWLVIRNSGAGGVQETPTTKLDRSVKTGRSMDEIAGSPSRKTTRASEAAKPTLEAAEWPRTLKRKPAERSAQLRRKLAEPPARAAKPEYVEPMKALGVTEIVGDDWQLEIKYDGFRALAILAEGKVELWSRNEKPLTSRFPEVVAGLSELPCKDVILDGEIVAVDEDGKPSFQRLQGVDSGHRRPPILYYVFDLLHLNGRSFLNEPLQARRAALEQFLVRTPDAVRLSPVFSETPAALLEEARRRGLEGIVGKRKDSGYEPGARSGAWVKCRIAQDQEFVIGGYTPPKGGRSHFGAVIVGYYEKGSLRYAGKVGTGFDAKSLASLHDRFRQVESTTCPFSDLPNAGLTRAGMREVTWLRPELVGQVKYSEWTRDGLLRQPVFLGLREDKPAREVVREASAGS